MGVKFNHPAEPQRQTVIREPEIHRLIKPQSALRCNNISFISSPI